MGQNVAMAVRIPPLRSNAATLVTGQYRQEHTMEHHADFAVSVTHRLWLETRVPHTSGEGMIRGWAIAPGWWVDANVNDDGTHGEPIGTLYLIVDEAQPGPPVWIAEGNVVRSRVDIGP